MFRGHGRVGQSARLSVPGMWRTEQVCKIWDKVLIMFRIFRTRFSSKTGSCESLPAFLSLSRFGRLSVKKMSDLTPIPESGRRDASLTACSNATNSARGIVHLGCTSPPRAYTSWNVGVLIWYAHATELASVNMYKLRQSTNRGTGPTRSSRRATLKHHSFNRSVNSRDTSICHFRLEFSSLPFSRNAYRRNCRPASWHFRFNPSGLYSCRTVLTSCCSVAIFFPPANFFTRIWAYRFFMFFMCRCYHTRECGK